MWHARVVQHAPHPSHTAETATPAPRAQDRFAQAVAPGVYPNRPVVFRSYGSGAQVSAEDPSRIELTFPVDAGRTVWISVNRGTAIEFLDSLIAATGGEQAFEKRREAARIAALKRGCRRGTFSSEPAAPVSAGEKENPRPCRKAPIAMPTAGSEGSP